MSWYTCIIKHAGVQLRTKVVYTYLIHTQQDAFTYYKGLLTLSYHLHCTHLTLLGLFFNWLPAVLSDNSNWTSVQYLLSVTLSSNCCQSQNYITTDGQSASLSCCQAPISNPRPIFLLLSLIILRQLRICWCGAPSLTRSRVCSFQFLLASPAQLFSGLSPSGLMSIFFYCLHFWDSPNLEGWAPIFIFLKNRVAKLYPRALGY
jgi:hypothetical protein